MNLNSISRWIYDFFSTLGNSQTLEPPKLHSPNEDSFELIEVNWKATGEYDSLDPMTRRQRFKKVYRRTGKKVAGNDL